MPSESFEHSQISGATMTSGGMSCERSGAIARGTNRVSAAPPGTNTLAVTPLPSSSCASAVRIASLAALEPPYGLSLPKIRSVWIRSMS
jgi:hypothetical protein